LDVASGRAMQSRVVNFHQDEGDALMPMSK
jgi:hypothetical protein